MAEKISLDKSELFILESGIIENQIYPDVLLEGQDVLLIKEATIKIAQGRTHALLVSAGENSSITKEGREISADSRYNGSNIASAFVIQSLAQRIIGNFYLTVNSPSITTRLFNDREKALVWLRKKLKKYNSVAKNKSKELI